MPVVEIPATAGAAGTVVAEAVSAAFVAASAERHRDPYHVGISSIGRCRRALAYALSCTPVSDEVGPGQGRAANLGTWIHEGLLPRLVAQLPGAVAEREVCVRVAGLTLPGHIDLDLGWATFDLKTVGEWRLQGVRSKAQAYWSHRMQVYGYAIARAQAGHTPAYVAWLYLDRGTGDQEIIVEPFTNRMVTDVIDYVTWLTRFADQPLMAPQDERGPGLSYACDDCPWLRTCWGPDAVPGCTGVQAVRSAPEIEAALADYVRAREAATAAGKATKDALARLERAPYGVYGAYKYGRSDPATVVDGQAAIALLTALGRDVPVTVRCGAVRVKLVTCAPTTGKVT